MSKGTELAAIAALRMLNGSLARRQDEDVEQEARPDETRECAQRELGRVSNAARREWSLARFDAAFSHAHINAIGNGPRSGRAESACITFRLMALVEALRAASAAWTDQRIADSDHRIPPDRQMVYGLELLAGVRTGEATRRGPDPHCARVFAVSRQPRTGQNH